MTLFPNRFQFTSPGARERESGSMVHWMLRSIWNIRLLASNWNTSISRSFTCFFSFFIFSTISVLLLLPDCLMSVRVHFSNHLCALFFARFVYVNWELFFSFHFFFVALIWSHNINPPASHGNDTSAGAVDAVTASPFDTGYRVRKLHEHISSCTFSFE